MPKLNFSKAKGARAVAIVKGGSKDGEVLYLHTDDTPSTGGGAGGPASEKKNDIMAVKYMKELKDMKPNEKVKTMQMLSEAYHKDTAPDNLIGASSQVKNVYKRILEDQKESKIIEIPDDGMFQVIPNPDPKVRECLYVAGMSGSGKSYFAKGYAEAYKKLFPDREVYLISKLNEDETLDSMKVGKPKRIPLDSLIQEPFDLEEVRDSLIIFDDWDTLDEPYLKTVHKMIEDICIMARHTNTSALILSHYLTNYKKTRLILGECQYIVVYPLATAFKALNYVLTNYGGLEKEQVLELKRLGRWVCIYKNYPSYLISAHKAYLLHQ
jgi:hypothetical protein